MFLIPDDYWEIKKTKQKGYGTFAKKDIRSGTVIGDYIGRVINIRSEDFFLKDKDLYLMYYSDKAAIYPVLKKQGIHLINHSCAPNCWIFTYHGHTLFFALRYIFTGEELTISYQLPPSQNKIKCFCKSKICTGSINLSENRYSKWLGFNSIVENQTRKARVIFGNILPILKEYPKNIPDNPIYPLFGSTQNTIEVLTHKIPPSIANIRKMIRLKGRILEFPGLNLKITGILDDKLI